MMNDDPYVDRTPDLIERVRKLRDEAEKKMNRFTRLADYEVRRLVGRKTSENRQTAIDFPSEIMCQGDAPREDS
jgi:hypothetical protein